MADMQFDQGWPQPQEKTEKKLQVHNLRISFRTSAGKVQAVRGISFDLNKGETLAIVGESGSGKSVTSKAVLGIQAGNAMTEDGEILYDGMDLLKIGEDDFYRLRGDKIAMIFQDPLSSLNPIMRIGKQLTEAMLLKGKARQKASQQGFRDKLNLLSQYMAAADPGQEAQIKERIESFRQLEMTAVKNEQAYNSARDCAQEALEECKNILFLIDKNAWKDLTDARKVKEFAGRCLNPYVVPEAEIGALRQEAEELNKGLKAQQRSGDFSKAAQHLQKIRDMLEKAVAKAEPHFLELAWQEKNPNASLQEGFLAGFEQQAEAGIRWADEKYLGLRREAVDQLNQALATLASGGPAALLPDVERLCKTVDESIDPIDVIKDSAACTFSSSLKGFAARWKEGIRSNDRKERKYQRDLKRSQRRAAKGKDWTVPAPTVIDLDTVSANMESLLRRLKEHYEERNTLEPQEDKLNKTRKLVRALEENASGMAARITKWAARNKALKLMEEVGISEPRKRYYQYPFEFSGGMRQRIVIAIALAADPDILICDEPTTALDVTIQAQILELINRLKAQRNLSIIFITHDLGVVANMADRIAVMYAGKIVEYGTAEDIFYSPAHPYTWALLSSMPDLDTKEKLEAIPGTPPNMIYPPKGDAFADRNRYAMEIDFEQQPPAFPISDTHWAATWLLHPDAPKVDLPAAVSERIAKMKARMEAMSHG